MYDVFIEAGQSNAEGSGFGPVTEEYRPSPLILYLTAPSDVRVTEDGLDIRYKNVPFVLEIADERDHSNGMRLGDLSLTFAQEYIHKGLLEPGRKVLIVRAAIGGTGFMKHHWGMGDPVYQKMLELADYALALHPESRLKGLLWHQGEHEVAEGNSAETYLGQMRMLIGSVKERYDYPDLPFICGGFAHPFAAEYEEKSKEIMSALQTVANELGGAFVETGDLKTNGEVTEIEDSIHFCRESLHILGRRYFQAYQTICSRKV